jgi:hypothetical protein
MLGARSPPKGAIAGERVAARADDEHERTARAWLRLTQGRRWSKRSDASHAG